jgi:neutral amino acid transport system permease protein
MSMTIRSDRMGRVGAVVLVVAMAVATLVSAATGAVAQDTPAYTGTLTDADGDPIVGAVIIVRDLDGAEIVTATTDDNGEWRAVVPSAGEYEVELDIGTLPEGVTLREGARNPTQIAVRTGQERQLLFPTTEGAARAGAWGSFLNRSLTGLKVGLILAMASVGLSLIFGTTKLINFAHGELVTFGAIVAWFINVSAGIHLVPAAILAVGVGALLGAGLETGMWARLRKRNVRGFQFLVLTIGLSLLAQNLLRVWFGSDFKRYAQYAFQRETQFGPVSISARDLAVMALSAIVLVAVASLLKYARIGKAMRAIADNPDLAESSGINVNRINVIVWAFGAGLAALGGVFLGVVVNIQYLMGFQLLLLMFAAVILGGLGSAYGAMIGGIVVGYISEVSTLWLRPELKTVWALVVLIAVLLLRPQGILGMRERIG